MSIAFLLTTLVVVITPGTGAVFTLFLAWQTFRDKSAIEVDDSVTPVSFWRVIRSAVLINLLNPKLTIFFFAFLPQFVPSGQENGIGQMAWLSFVFMVVTFIVFAVYGVFAAAMRNQVINRPKVMAWLRRSFAATYVLLAGRLPLESR